jgi:hypothetical protein
MAYAHGSKARVHFNGYDLSAYLTSVTLSTMIDTAETTTLSATAKSYIVGNRDNTASGEGIFDGEAGNIDVIIQAALGAATAKPFSYLPQGDTVGNEALVGIVHQTSYEIQSPVDGVTSLSFEAQSDAGIYPGVVLAPLTARTATANGTSTDNAAATANGFVANLHLTAVSGTLPSATVIVQHSTDNSTWVTLGSFTAATSANTAQSITGTGAVYRYARAQWTITGTGPSLTFSVALARK